jgi:hypothetical protein
MKTFHFFQRLVLGSLALSLVFPRLAGGGGSSSPLEIEIKKSIAVYKTQNEESQNQLIHLKPGDVAFLSMQKTGFWRKILIPAKGAAKIGWVPVSVLRENVTLKKRAGSEPVELDLPSLRAGEGDAIDSSGLNKRHYHQSTAFGLTTHVSHLKWSTRTITLSDETNWTVSETTSTTFWPSVFMDISFGKKSMVRVFGGRRTAHFEGSSNRDFIGTKQTGFELDFLTLGLIYKSYFKSSNRLWWGIEGEWSLGQNLKIVYDNEEIEVSDDDLPIFISLAIVGGYDIPLTNSIYFLPDLRIGSVFNQDPRIYLAEIGLAIALRF